MLFQKLSVADCPLYLRLLAGPDNDVLSFVLKENETGEVEVGLGPFARCANPALRAAWPGTGGHCPLCQQRWVPGGSSGGCWENGLGKLSPGEVLGCGGSASKARIVSILGKQVRACVWQGLWKERISCAFLLKTQGGGGTEKHLCLGLGRSCSRLARGPASSISGLHLDMEIFEPFVSSWFLKNGLLPGSEFIRVQSGGTELGAIRLVRSVA